MGFPSIPKFPTPAAIKALLGSTMASLSGKIPKTSDITGLNLGKSVSSDKVFTSVSQNKTTSNVFGVFDTKQSVKELSGKTDSSLSMEKLLKADPKKLLSLTTKLKIPILSDLAYAGAVVSAIGKVLKSKQLQLSIVGSLIGIPLKGYSSSTGKMYSSYGNMGNPYGIIPGSMSVADFTSMQGLYNNGGLGGYNTCQNVSNAFGYGVTLIDPKTLAASLLSLFGILGKNDMKGILNCMHPNTYSSLTVQQRSSMSGNLVSGGAILGLSDLFGSSNRGTVTNPYSTIRSAGMSRQTTYDPFTQRPTNTFRDGDTRTAADSLFSSLGISDKSSVFSTRASNNSKNVSITDKMSDDVYDRQAINSCPEDNGFSDYCFGDSGNNRLISSVPDSLFA